VDVKSELDRVRALLLGVTVEDRDILSDPPPLVVVMALNDYNVEMELQAWIRDEALHIPERFELRERMFNASRDAGIEMPFETIEVRTASAG
jgi:small conductance mechanosensitive channel